MHEVVGEAVIDTNVLIYDLVEDSIHHSEAEELLDRLDTWIIPTIVVHELVWFLKAMGMSINEAYSLILQYIDNEKSIVKPVDTVHVKKALTMLSAEKLSLARYNDKLILALALMDKKPLATFDEKLRRQATRVHVNVLP